MVKTRRVRLSARTFWNWLLDAVVIVSASLAILSGMYFLFLPVGYQGGRNPYYDLVILFPRVTWDLIHTWSSIVLIVALIVHFAIHLHWVGMMGRKMTAMWRGEGSGLSSGARLNLWANLAVAVTFLICAASGIYFLFAPAGGYQGGRVAGWDPGFLFARTTWDLIHTWSGVALSLAALVHIAIHWRWLTQVTAKVGRAPANLWVRPASTPLPAVADTK